MILMYRILFRGLLKLTYQHLVSDLENTFPTTRGHQYKIFKYTVRYNARTNFFYLQNCQHVE